MEPTGHCRSTADWHGVRAGGVGRAAVPGRVVHGVGRRATAAGSVNREYYDEVEQLGGGVSGTVYAMAVLADGRLAFGGNFDYAGGLAAHDLALWNGVGWSGLTALGNFISALVALPDGLLIQGNDTFTGVWNGSRIAYLDMGSWVTCHGSGCGGWAHLPGATDRLRSGPQPSVYRGEQWHR